MEDMFYTCPYCKEEYTNPSDLAHCILSCEEKKKIEERKRKKAELALEKEMRTKEVDDAWTNYVTLLKAYVKDYGSYSMSTGDSDDTLLSVGKMMPWWF